MLDHNGPFDIKGEVSGFCKKNTKRVEIFQDKSRNLDTFSTHSLEP